MNITANRIRLKLPLLALIVASSTLFVGCAGKHKTHDEIVRADLAVIIESLGSPCKKVLNYKTTGALAYTVSCESGQQYLISVNPQGRVGVQPHE